MHRGVESGSLLVGVLLRSGYDHGIVSHAAADEPPLTGECRCGTLADDHQLLAVVLFPPGKVVMVVDQVDFLATKNPDHLPRDPLPAGVGVPAGERHEIPVRIAHWRLQVEQDLALGHSFAPLPPLAQGQEPRRDGMTEPSAPEVNADPDAAQLIAENVDVMVPAPDGAELGSSLGLELVVFVLPGNGFPGRVGE